MVKTRKYVLITIMLFMVLTLGVGVSKWNIHYRMSFEKQIIKFAENAQLQEDDKNNVKDNVEAIGTQKTEAHTALIVKDIKVDEISALETKDRITYDGNGIGITVAAQGDAQGDAQGVISSWADWGITIDVEYFKYNNGTWNEFTDPETETPTDAGIYRAKIKAVSSDQNNPAVAKINVYGGNGTLSTNANGNDSTNVNGNDSANDQNDTTALALAKINVYDENGDPVDENGNPVSTYCAFIDFEIKPKPVTLDWKLPEDLVYDGNAKNPTATYVDVNNVRQNATITITDQSGTVIENAIDAGTYTATATISDTNYAISGESDQTFIIEPKPVTLEWTAPENLVYDGNKKIPMAKVTNLVVGDTCEVTTALASGDDINVGTGEFKYFTYKATDLSNDNYELPDNVNDVTSPQYTIKPKPVTLTWLNTTFTYDGKAHAPTAKYFDVNGKEQQAEIKITSPAGIKSAIDAGTYEATATISNTNYAISGESVTTFTINKAEVTLTWNMPTDLVYDGTAKNPTATYVDVTGEKQQAVIKITSPAGIESAIDAGTYKATATISDTNYAISGESVTTFIINKAEVTLTWNVGTYTYNGTAQAPTAQITSGLVSSDTCTVTVDGAKNAGTHTAKAKLDGEDKDNYTIKNSTEEFTINKAQLTITANNITVSAGMTPDYTVTYTGFVNNETETVLKGTLVFECAYSATVQNPEKTYTIRPTGLESNNYQITYINGTLTVTGLTTIPVPQIANTTLVYNGTEQTFVTADNYANFDCVTLTNNTGTNAGKYVVTFTIKDTNLYIWDDNTSDPKTITFTIAKATLTKPTENKDVTFAYSGENQVDNILNTGFNDYNTTDYVDKITVTKPTNAINAGINYTFTFTPTANYMWADGTSTKVTITIIINYLKLSLLEELLSYTYGDFPDGIPYSKLYDNVVANSSHNLSSLVSEIQYSITKTGGLTTIASSGKITQGSTYKITYTPHNSNIQFVGNNYCYLQYKTAIVNGTYYTIEDAIAQTGNITVAGNATSPVITSFSHFTSADYAAFNNYPTNHTFTISGRTLLIPFDDTNKVHTGDKSSTTATNTYAALVVPEGITINFTDNAKLHVGAHTSAPNNGNCANVREHGVLMNDGTINLASGCEFLSYGYTKSSSSDSPGIIIAQNDVNITEFMYSHDWPGGSASIGAKDDYFVTNAWTIHNISCKLKINSGAKYSVYVAVIVTFFGYTETTAEIIGNTSSNNCLFAPTAVSDNNYIIKHAKPAAAWAEKSEEYKSLYTITGNNLTKGNKSVIEIYGDYTDKTLSVSVGTTISTSTSISAPLGYTDVIIKQGATLTLSSSDFVYMPGTYLEVESGATLNIQSGVDAVFLDWGTVNKLTSGFKSHCVDKKDSYALINGTVNVSGNIGGKIVTESPDAFISLQASNNASYTLMCATSSPYGEKQSKGLTGNVDGKDTTMPANNVTSYVSICDNNNCYWTAATSYSSYTIVKDLGNGETQSDKMFYSGTAPTITAATLGTPQRDYYDFAGWYEDAEFTTPFTTKTVTADTTYTVYAKWEVKTYYIKFVVFDKQNNILDASNYTNESTATSYTAESPLTLGKITGNNGCATWKFDGNWYLFNPIDNTYVSLCNVSGNNIVVDPYAENPPENYDTLLSYVYGANTTEGNAITLYTWLRELSEFTITYHYQATDDYTTYYEKAEKLTYLEGDVVTLLDLTSYNKDTKFKYYYNRWYTAEDYTGEQTDGFVITSNLNLYAKPIEKQQMTITGYVNDGSTEENNKVKFDNLPATIYLSPGETKYDIGATAVANDNWQHKITGYSIETPTTGVSVNGDGVIIFKNVSSEITDITIKLTVTTAQYYQIKLVITEAKITINNNTYEESTTLKKFVAGQEIKYAITLLGNRNQQWSIKNDDTDKSLGSGGADSDGTFTMPESNVTITAYSECLVEGTLITLADGTKKKVELITENDILLVFNHETGKYDFAKVLFNDTEPQSQYTVINLRFANGKLVKVVSEHGFFDLTLNKYVYIDETNYADFVGHTFYQATWNGTDYISSTTTLANAYLTTENVKVYSPVTTYHMNYFTEDLLSMPGGIEGLFNIFEYDTNLQYNKELMQQDIDTYGLFTYDDFKDLVPIEIYNAFPAQYFKVAMGKNLLTWEQLNYYIERYAPLMIEDAGTDTDNAQDNSQSPLYQDDQVLLPTTSGRSDKDEQEESN